MFKAVFTYQNILYTIHLIFPLLYFISNNIASCLIKGRENALFFGALEKFMNINVNTMQSFLNLFFLKLINIISILIRK